MNLFQRTARKLLTKTTGLTPEEAFLTGRPLGSALAGKDSVDGAYKLSPVAYACVRRIATDAGSAPFLLLSDPENNESTIPDSHPIAQLFNRPNPWYSTDQFMQYIYMMLNLRGEFFIAFDDPGKPKEMIQFFDPLYWREYVNSKMRLLYYKFTHSGVSLTQLPNDIIHHQLNNPGNPYRGQSPLVAAASPLWTSIGGDDLANDLMVHGGEQGIVYSTEDKLTPTQEEELAASLRARRKNAAKVANDILLTGNTTIIDPKFTGFDYKLFDLMQPSEQKIVQVYGLSPSLIGNDDEPNYATFEGRLRIYWRNTLLPQMLGVESTMDKFFEPFGVYFRYDQDNIRGLQEDLKELSEIAVTLHEGGLPWDVINDRLNLGVNMVDVPGSEDVLVPVSRAPLSVVMSEWTSGGVTVADIGTRRDSTDSAADKLPARPARPARPAAKQPDPEPERGPVNPCSYEERVRRYRSITSITERNTALAGLMRAVASGWRKQALEYRGKTNDLWRSVVADNPNNPDAMVQHFQLGLEPLLLVDHAEDSLALIMPREVSAAGVGETSVEELTKRLDPEQLKRVKQDPTPTLSARTLAYIADRRNMITAMSQNLFNDIMEQVNEIFLEQYGEVGDVANFVADIFNVIGNEYSTSTNRAATIARTEVGTAFNVGRISNMEEQGYLHHQWLSDLDEVTRTEEGNDHWGSNDQVRVIGELFPSGVAFPQDPQGKAKQVINCRCLTLPLTEEEYDELSKLS